MNNNKTKLLIVDDDETIVEIVANILDDRFQIYTAYDGLKAYDVYKKHSPSIIISDIAMPNMDGIELIKKIRVDDHNTKAIILTSHSEINYLLKSNSLKLTKYCLKPIEKDELLEAVDLALDELNRFNTIKNDILKIDDDFMWDFTNLELTKNGIEVPLTPKERLILNYLLRNQGVVTTYDKIIFEVWDQYETATDKTLKTMITNLRKKLPKDMITNIFGLGYKVSIKC